MNKIEHIGIAVKDLKMAGNIYSRLLGVESYKTELVESEMVRTMFFNVGNNKVELLEATSEESTIAKYIQKRGEGVHHLAFEVDDILLEMKRLQEEGFELLNKEPKKGADNKLVCFIHPKDANGVLIELCQQIK